jgi:hypothetical protein
MTDFDVCVVGSTNLDLVCTAPVLPLPGETVMGDGYAEHPGGKGLNQAVAAARTGARTAFVSAVGDDAAGSALLDVVLYFLMPDCLSCYRCGARYRGPGIADAFAGFDLETHEKHRQIAARTARAEATAARRGGAAGRDPS